MPIEFQLIGIETPQFAIIKDDDYKDLRIDFEVNFSVDDQISTMQNTVKVVYSKDAQPVMQLVVCCYFMISPDSWSDMTKEDGTVVIPVDFLQHMTSITIGTTRGVLQVKTEGAKLNNAIIPLVNVADMIKNDMVITPDSD